MELAVFFAQPLPAGQRSGRHHHPYHELVWMTGSSGWIDFGRGAENYGPGALSVHPAGEAHDCFSEDEAVHLCLGLSGKDLAGLKSCIRTPGDDVRSLLTLLERESRRASGLDLDLVRHLAMALAMLLLRDPAATGVGEEPATAAKALLDAHFRDEDMGLDRLARSLYLNKAQIRYLFKKEYGTTPLHYLIQKKIAFAKERLASPGARVREVAAEAGFTDEYYFNRVFKQITGVTPGRWHRERADRPKPTS